MEKLSIEKRTEVSKMSTERLRARLIKAGDDENEVVEMDRSNLLSTYAEYLLSPPIPESPEKAHLPWYECGGVRVEETEKGEVTAGVGVAKRGTADAERDATTGIGETGEGRRGKKTGRRAEAR